MDGTFTITPFWNRIPKIFQYGLHKYPLLLTAIIFFASLLFGGPFVNIILLIVAIKYGVEVLKSTMEGDFTPPRITYETINNNFGLALKLIFVFFLYGFLLSGISSGLGLWLGIPIYIAGILLIPAVVISFVVSEEISYSLNPTNLWHIASSIGWPYLIMTLFLSFIDGMNTQVIGFVVELFPDTLVAPLFVALNVFFTVVMFHLLGYVVLQYHQQLGGYTPAMLADNEDIKRGDPYLTPQLKALLDENNVEGSINELSSIIDNHPQQLEPRRRLYVCLKLNGQNDKLRDYAPRYFNRLAEQGRFSDAATVYLESSQRGYPFMPDDPSDYLPVMRELKRRHAAKQAVALAQGFHKRFPGNAHIPEVYLALAQILSEEMQRDDLAQQALHFVLNNFPDHPLAPLVRNHLTVLTNLQGATS